MMHMKSLYNVILSRVDENIFHASEKLDAHYLISNFQKSSYIPRNFRYFYKSVLTKYMESFKSIKDSQYFVIANFSVDYPDFAQKVCQEILNAQADLGVLICGTGIGISIAANRFKGIRAALLYSDDVARLAKLHNNANIAVFGGRTMSVQEMKQRLDIFLNTEFEGGRHQRRIEMLDD